MSTDDEQPRNSVPSPILDRRRLLKAAAASSLVAGVVGAGLSVNEAAADSILRNLPIGKWTIRSDGQEGTLTINSVDAQGRVTGVALGKPIEGLWDKADQQLTFLRQARSNRWQDTATFTGFLFTLPIADNRIYVLAGTFRERSTAQRTEFGWYATMTVIG